MSSSGIRGGVRVTGGVPFSPSGARCGVGSRALSATAGASRGAPRPTSPLLICVPPCRRGRSWRSRHRSRDPDPWWIPVSMVADVRRYWPMLVDFRLSWPTLVAVRPRCSSVVPGLSSPFVAVRPGSSFSVLVRRSPSFSVVRRRCPSMAPVVSAGRISGLSGIRSQPVDNGGPSRGFGVRDRAGGASRRVAPRLPAGLRRRRLGTGYAYDRRAGLGAENPRTPGHLPEGGPRYTDGTLDCSRSRAATRSGLFRERLLTVGPSSKSGVRSLGHSSVGPTSGPHAVSAQRPGRQGLTTRGPAVANSLHGTLCKTRRDSLCPFTNAR